MPFDMTPEEIQKARDIQAGLLVNKLIGPMLDTLERNYEEPLDSYKLSGKLIKMSGLMRWSIKTLLRATGNRRVANVLTYFRPLKEKEIDNLILDQRSLQYKML